MSQNCYPLTHTHTQSKETVFTKRASYQHFPWYLFTFLLFFCYNFSYKLSLFFQNTIREGPKFITLTPFKCAWIYYCFSRVRRYLLHSSYSSSARFVNGSDALLSSTVCRSLPSLGDSLCCFLQFISLSMTSDKMWWDLFLFWVILFPLRHERVEIH